MLQEEKYRFSFTAASLRTEEMARLARLHVKEGIKAEDLQQAILEDGVVLGQKKNTTKRELFEFELRLETLTNTQRELLATGDLDTQRQVSFLAVCKLYRYIREFVLEALCEKVAIYDNQLNEGDYFRFFNGKADQYEEIDQLAESTQYKIKQVTFKMLEQAGLIDNITDRQILPQFLDGQVERSIVQENPQYLKFFLYSDSQIDQLSQEHE